jgi:hypothetical protein
MDKLIPDAAVQAIQQSVETKIITVDGREFTTRPVHEIPSEPSVETLQLTTLTGLVEYLNEVQDLPLVKADITAVHVLSPFEVRAVTRLGEKYLSRDMVARATVSSAVDQSRFSFNQYHDHETFIVSLLSLFEDRADRTKVLRLVGNIADENVRQFSDNGVTQSVVARSGVVKVAEVEVPNPVTLAPFRTFPEVEQPASLFVLRLKKGREGEQPHAALFEADGGRWRLAAMRSIKVWLTERLPGVTVVA